MLLNGFLRKAQPDPLKRQREAEIWETEKFCKEEITMHDMI